MARARIQYLHSIYDVLTSPCHKGTSKFCAVSFQRHVFVVRQTHLTFHAFFLIIRKMEPSLPSLHSVGCLEEHCLIIASFLSEAPTEVGKIWRTPEEWRTLLHRSGVRTSCLKEHVSHVLLKGEVFAKRRERTPRDKDGCLRRKVVFGKLGHSFALIFPQFYYQIIVCNTETLLYYQNNNSFHSLVQCRNFREQGRLPKAACLRRNVIFGELGRCSRRFCPNFSTKSLFGM